MSHTNAVLPKMSAKEALGPQCGLFWNLGPHLVRIEPKKWAFSPQLMMYADIYKKILKLPYWRLITVLFVEFHWSQ